LHVSGLMQGKRVVLETTPPPRSIRDDELILQNIQVC
jgi:hypothetical protein